MFWSRNNKTERVRVLILHVAHKRTNLAADFCALVIHKICVGVIWCILAVTVTRIAGDAQKKEGKRQREQIGQ